MKFSRLISSQILLFQEKQGPKTPIAYLASEKYIDNVQFFVTIQPTLAYFALKIGSLNHRNDPYKGSWRLGIEEVFLWGWGWGLRGGKRVNEDVNKEEV